VRNIQTQDCLAETGSESTWSDAAKLSRKVREVAHRSYRALNPSTRTDAPAQARPEDLAEDLRDLCAQVARLQRKIHERRLNALIPWVDALRRRVEDRLELARKAETR
jgi:hypothetical protein